jgi:hypothetical protein
MPPSAGAATTTAVNRDLLAAFASLRRAEHQILQDIQLLRGVVASRIPEIKEEDNGGVHVQFECLKYLEECEKALVKGGGDRFPALPPVSATQEYLSSRVAVEEKLDPCGKDEKPSNAPSAILRLQQLDVDAAMAVERGFSALASLVASLVVLFTENRKKLFLPRVSMDRMVH